MKKTLKSDIQPRTSSQIQRDFYRSESCRLKLTSPCAASLKYCLFSKSLKFQCFLIIIVKCGAKNQFSFIQFNVLPLRSASLTGVVPGAVRPSVAYFIPLQPNPVKFILRKVFVLVHLSQPSLSQTRLGSMFLQAPLCLFLPVIPGLW